MELFGCGAQVTPPPHILLDESRSTTTIDGEASVMTPSLVSLKLMSSATSWDILEPPATLRHLLIRKRKLVCFHSTVFQVVHNAGLEQTSPPSDWMMWIAPPVSTW